MVHFVTRRGVFSVLQFVSLAGLGRRLPKFKLFMKQVREWFV